MDKNGFWEIIENSRSVLSSNDPDGNLEQQAQAIKLALSELSEEEVLSFANIFHSLKEDLYTWELWGAAYVIGGGCSDDGFADFRNWIISLGREAYELALSSPDDLGPVSSDSSVEDVFFEELAYIPEEVFEEQFDKELDIAVPYSPDPKGKEWDEDTVDSLYPKLAKLYAE